jgi:hypothetical protein
LNNLAVYPYTLDWIRDETKLKFSLTTLALNLGFALGMEGESSGVWMNAAATALHKFVISFSVGVELISNKVRITLENRIFIKRKFQASLSIYSISTCVFSFAAALGSFIGLVKIGHYCNNIIDM